jgi:hypothetical protein
VKVTPATPTPPKAPAAAKVEAPKPPESTPKPVEVPPPPDAILTPVNVEAPTPPESTPKPVQVPPPPDAILTPANVEAPTPLESTPIPVEVPPPPDAILTVRTDDERLGEIDVVEEPIEAPIVAVKTPLPPPPERRPVELAVAIPVPTPPPSTPARVALPSFHTLDAFRPAPDPLAVAKMTPAVTARRAQFQRYVKGVVGVCAALCLVALVRVAIAASPSDTAQRGVPSVIKKAVASKTIAIDQEVRAVHEAWHATAWVRKGGARHR